MTSTPIEQYDGGTAYDERARFWHWIGMLTAGAAFWLFVWAAWNAL